MFCPTFGIAVFADNDQIDKRVNPTIVWRGMAICMAHRLLARSHSLNLSLWIERANTPLPTLGKNTCSGKQHIIPVDSLIALRH